MTLLILAATVSLSAQEAPAAPEETAPAAQPTGQTAAVAAKMSKENNWQNWVFVGGALVAAGVAILVISLDSGSSAH